MESERRKIRPATAKRKPFSDLTNTLIPNRISTKPQFLKSLNPNPTKSDSSIGSSNFNNVTNPSIFSTSPPRPSRPRTSSTNLRNGDVSEPLVVNSLKQTTNKTKKSRGEDAIVPYTDPSIRPIPEPVVSTPPPQSRSRTSSINLRNGDVLEPLVIYSRKQTTDKTKKSRGENAVVPYTDPILEKTRGREKKGSSELTQTPVEKTKDKGKGIFVPFSSLSSVKTNAKGKAVAPSYHNLEENNQRGAMVVPMAQSCPPQRITRNNRKQFNEAVDSSQPKLHTDPRPTKKKRLFSSQEYDVQPSLPQDFVEQQRAYFKEIDDFELLEEEVSD